MPVNLQEQRDTEFADSDEMDLQQQANAELATSDGDEGLVDFADGVEDDYPPPPILEDDGNEKPAVTDFADTGDNKPAEAPARKASTHDVHAESDEGEPSQQAEKPTFSNDLMSRAAQYGVAPQQAQQMFGTPEELEAALLFMDQRALNEQQVYQQQQAQYQQQQQAVTQPVMRQPVQAPQQQQQAVENPAQQQQQGNLYELKSEDLYDPALTEDLQGLQSHLIGIIQGQQQSLTQLQEQAYYQQQAMQQWMQQQQYDRAVKEFEEFDEYVSSLGEDWSDILGDGHSQELPQNSPQLINRQKLFQTANNLRGLHAQQGRNVSLSAATPNALKMAFPDRNQTTATWNQQQSRDQQGRFTARPAKRKQSVNGNRREAALQRWDKAIQGESSKNDQFGAEFQDGV